jgi:hypothetical protein
LANLGGCDFLLLPGGISRCAATDFGHASHGDALLLSILAREKATL